MSDKWDFYLATKNGKLASLFVDIGVAQEAPKEDRRVLLAVLVKQKAPRHDGLTTKEEADRLWPLEDALVPAVQAWGGVYVGRITTDGRRDFFFYGLSSDGFDAVVSQAIEPFVYDFETFERADAGWSFYFKFLYPAPRNWQQIMNRHVLENLKQGGDDLSKPRRIFHWLYFASEMDRDRCAQVARERGFGTSAIPAVEKPDNKFPLGLQLYRIDSVAPREIDNLTLALYDLAQDNSGNYDGWETQIVKAGDEPKDDAPAPA